MKKLALVLCLIACAAPLAGAEEPASEQKSRVAYVFDTGVLCTKQKPSNKELASLVFRVFLKHPASALSAIYNFAKIRARGDEIMQSTNGTTNITLKALEELKNQGYADLRTYVPDIVNMSLNPEPNQAVIEEIKKLKQQVPPPHIVVATNQDRQQFLFWCEKMRQKGVDIENLCDRTVTAWCPADYVSADRQEVIVGASGYTQFADDSVMCPENVTTSSPEYFYLVSKVVAQQAPAADVVIYTGKDAKALENAASQKNFAPIAYEIEKIQKGAISFWKRRVNEVLKQRGL